MIAIASQSVTVMETLDKCPNSGPYLKQNTILLAYQVVLPSETEKVSNGEIGSSKHTITTDVTAIQLQRKLKILFTIIFSHIYSLD